MGGHGFKGEIHTEGLMHANIVYRLCRATWDFRFPCGAYCSIHIRHPGIFGGQIIQYETILVPIGTYKYVEIPKTLGSKPKFGV